MKQTIEPFICLNDFEGFEAFSEGYHSHGGKMFNVHTISIGYPIADWSRGERKTFTIDKPKEMTAELLMSSINAVVVSELTKGNNFAPHAAEDYCIEHITVMDGVAEVEFGS